MYTPPHIGRVILNLTTQAAYNQDVWHTFFSSNIPISPAYGILPYQHIKYAGACPSYRNVLFREQLLTCPCLMDI